MKHFINRKPLIVYGMTLALFFLFFISIILSGTYFPGEGIVLGVITLVCSIILHWVGKTKTIGYIGAFVFNAIGSGCFVSMYYDAHPPIPENKTMLLSALVPFGILTLTCLALLICEKIKSVVIAVAVVVHAVFLLISLVYWAQGDTQYYGLQFFLHILSLYTLGVLGVTVGEERSVWRDLSLGSFGSFLIIAAIVILILSEGEILEGLDIGGSGRKSKK